MRHIRCYVTKNYIECGRIKLIFYFSSSKSVVTIPIGYKY